MKNVKAVLAVTLVATLAACGRDPAIPFNASDVSMEQVGFQQTYQNTGFQDPARLVIRDQKAWEDAWAILTEPYVEPIATPEVDFETSMVLLAAMGWRSHGGYTIELSDAATTEDAFYASVTETSPGGMCATTQALVEPATVTRVPRFDGEVKFIENAKTVGCF